MSCRARHAVWHRALERCPEIRTALSLGLPSREEGLVGTIRGAW
jgi:hypothetical protein